MRTYGRQSGAVERVGKEVKEHSVEAAGERCEVGWKSVSVCE